MRSGTTVGQLMTAHITGASPGDSVQTAARTMRSRNLECLVVVQRGRLVGIAPPRVISGERHLRHKPSNEAPPPRVA